MARRRLFLGQAEADPLLWPTGEPLAAGETSSRSLWPEVYAQASTFLSNYQAWQSGGAADLADALATIRAARFTAGQAQAEALAAGDTEGVNALAVTVADLDAAIAEGEQARAQADSYQGTWDTIAAVLQAGGGMVGLGLPLVPAALTAAVAVAAVGALAYVVTTWQATRSKANALASWTADVAAGRLTTAQVTELAKAGGLDTGSGLLAGLLGGGAGMVLLLVGAALVFLWPMRRGA